MLNVEKMGDFTNKKRVNTPFITCKIILIFVHTNDEKKLITIILLIFKKNSILVFR